MGLRVETGNEPAPDTVRKIKAGERTGPLDFVLVILDPPNRMEGPQRKGRFS